MSRKQNSKIANYIRVLCLSGALVAYSASAYAVVANNTLPTNGQWQAGSTGTINSTSNIMNIVQNEQNAVIKWGDFSIGANATVNFSKDGGGKFNILNYVDSGKVSEIYGAMNAKDGNVFVANTAGVVIGKSAQINVGSLYVTNKKLDESQFSQFNGSINDMFAQNQHPSAAELMSLGNINAKTVTFDGDRVVLDTDRISGVMNGNQISGVADITVNSTTGDIVLGSDEGKAGSGNKLTVNVNDSKVSDNDINKEYNYIWIKNVEDLQNINKDLDKNYALNDSIDAIVTKDWNDGNGFVSIGNDKNAFTGKFDGLDYSIFGLTINRTDESNVGLFGVVNGATINNVTIVSGNIKGGENVGAVVGKATNTHLNNIVNSAHVVGNKNVGGVIGSGDNVVINGAINTAPVKGHENVGGLAGELTNGSKLIGQSYNLGAVTGIKEDGSAETTDKDKIDEIKNNKSHNIGGLVGSASKSTLGDGSNQIFNQLDVKGGYNVGGIVGNMMDGTTVTNAANNGNITAVGYTNENYKYHGNKQEGRNPGEKIIENINVANVGGIAGNVNGSTISNVENTGNIKSIEVTKNDDKFSVAGNVGGIVGRAENTNISNAENKENEILGAHNVGGIAGYFGAAWGNDANDKPIYTISDSINNGGDIMATGIRDKNYDALTENVTFTYSSDEKNEVAANIVGNMGGIAGYMYGDNTQIKNSSNRGLVHSRYINENDSNNIKNSAKASNSGGIVGKIDRQNTTSIDELKKNAENAAVVDSYNTGSVHGYANLGGIAGMMYNGEIVRSYNAGNIRSTRKPAASDTSNNPVNMGGIVGDSTENVQGVHISLYDVYNRGEIGDKEFIYGSRHVGGVVGRLSGDIDTAYNKGNIYNTMIVNGGIAGWWVSTGRESSIKNVFNTGNITVNNRNATSDPTSVGGIIGGTGQRNDASLSISNAYNLGTIRSFNKENIDTPHSVGGIVGTVSHGTLNLIIKNVYTTGELYADNNTNLGSIYGKVNDSGWKKTDENIQNTYYIKAQNEEIFKNIIDQSNKAIAYANKDDIDSYKYEKNGETYSLFDNNPNDTGGDWRIYGDTTPILNAFLPKLAEGSNLNDKTNVNVNGGDKVQYGTAYNPFATIITTSGDKNINVDDSGAGAIDNVDSIIVNGGSLTIENASNTGNTMYNGILYADGALILNGTNISLGSISHLYGSSVTINSEGNLKAYGDITATGNNGASDVNLNAAGGNIEILGTITSKGAGEATVIPGIGNIVGEKDFGKVEITDPDSIMPDVSTQYSKKDIESTVTGNVIITSDQKVDILLGNLQDGFINTSGNLTVKGKEVYMDSDLNIGGDLTINGDTTVLDISNIGKVQANNRLIDKDDTPEEKALIGLHRFLDHFKKDNHTITMKDYNGGNNSDAIIAVDLWDESEGAFDLGKYDIDDRLAGDTPSKEKHYLYDDLNELNLTVNDKSQKSSDNEKGSVSRKVVNVWVSNGEQLKALQNANKIEHGPKADIFKSNIALKNDIDMSDVKGFVSIGTGNKDGFTGKFDGRGNRIIGLDVNNGGLFDTIGKDGKVDDVKIYSSNIKSTKDKSFIGMIAATNKGTISNVTTFGNSIDIGTTGVAGGLVGNNEGTIESSTATNVVQSSGKTKSVLGGIAGVNSDTIKNSESNSAITTSGGFSNAMGGITGVNQSGGLLENVTSQGIVTGLYDTGKGEYHVANTVGGIAGKNEYSGTIKQAYNDSIVSGMQNVGGIVGENDGTVSNLANATYVYGGDNVGGVAGVNNGSMTNGRNNGSIIGGAGIKDKDADNQKKASKGSNVGGLVGIAGEGSTMKDLTNDMSASITGKDNVGGLIGYNQGILSDSHNLMNKGTISGVTNVGGVIGANEGIIANINNENSFNIIVNTAYDKDGSVLSKDHFGGIIGHNEKNGIVYNVSSSSNVNTPDANYTGGIIGENDGVVLGLLVNGGNVTGKDNVGGIIGINNAEIDSTNDKSKAAIEKLQNIKDEEEKNIIDINAEKAVVHLVNGAKAYVDKDNVNDFSFTKFVLSKNKVTGTKGVGGVIAVNNGKITHTDVINTITGTVTGETNVGGLIGTNTGSVQGGRDDNDQYYKYQVYNNGTVTGTNSVGGLIGENGIDAKLIAGYNTGASNGAGVVGNNSGKVDQVFTTTDNGVAGDGSTGTVTNSYYVKDGKQELVNKTDSDVWKQYKDKDDKNLSDNLLTIFLTKVTIKFDENFKPVYDGNEHKFVFGKEIINNGNGTTSIKFYYGSIDENNLAGTITVAGPNSEHNLQDYIKSFKGDENDLLQSVVMQNAGKYGDYLYSHQINTKGEANNPNNLGFNFVTSADDKEFEVAKKQLTITLDEIFRKYGSLDIYDGIYDDWTVEGLIAKDSNLKKYIEMTFKNDGALTGKEKGEVTKDVGDYEWNAEFKFSNSDAMSNYELSADSVIGKSHVTKADLNVNIGDITISKGESLDGKFNGTISGITNNDSKDELGIGDWNITNKDLIYQAGTHNNVIGVYVNETPYYFDGSNNDVLKNYNLILNPGTLTVTSDEYQFWEAEDKYAWGKKREERERKAEVYFVSGGMEL